VRTQGRRRPTPWQWVWYAFGGGLPHDLAPWVLADTTTRTWWLRHLARAAVQMLPLVAICLFAVPVPFGYRASAAFGGLFIGLIFSMAFMTETTEHRVAKAGYPAGTAAEVREERAERERAERSSPYRQGGAGSFD
jgi:drug/metabolite transporter superfamily protein YnfA